MLSLSPTRDTRRLRLLFVGLMVGLLLSELDQNVFATALPTIVGELDGVDRMLWVTTAYVSTSTIVMPVYGKLGDLVGRRTLFIAALAIFVVGSVIGGLAPDLTTLIAGRAVQGLGGGGLLILVQAIVADVIPARERAPYMSVVGAVFALAAVLGPVLGGWLTGSVGWRWAFWLNVPLGGLAIACAVAFLPSARRTGARVVVDVWGITTLSVAVAALVLISAWGGTVHPWTSATIVTLAVLGAASAALFVFAETRAAEPIIGLHLFRERNFTITTGAALVLAVAVFGTVGYLPTYLQLVSGLSPTGSGLMMLCLITGLASTTVGSARLVQRTGRYRWLPVAGSGLAAVALGWLSTLPVGAGLRTVGGCLFLLGAGMGCALEILVVIVQNTFPTEVGTATAVHSFFREVGVTLGSAVVGAAFTSRLTARLAERVPVPSAYHDALAPLFGYLVPLLLLSAVGLCLVRPVPLATTVSGPQPPSETVAAAVAAPSGVSSEAERLQGRSRPAAHGALLVRSGERRHQEEGP